MPSKWLLAVELAPRERPGLDSDSGSAAFGLREVEFVGRNSIMSAVGHSVHFPN